MVRFGLQHRQRRVGEDGVVSAAREQLLLPGFQRGLSHRTRRTIKRPVTWSSNRCRWARNSANDTSATSASEIQRCSASSKIAYGVADRGGDTESGSGLVGRGDHGAGIERRIGAKNTSPQAPQRRATCNASVTKVAAPRASGRSPRRSRVAAITGAANGVEAVATNAFNPLTPV
jgi:hypothetical protein